MAGGAIGDSGLSAEMDGVEKMKQQLIKNAIAVWVAAGSIFLSAVPSFSMENKKGEGSSPTRSIQTEAPPDRSPVMSRPERNWRRRIYFNPSLQFEAKARRETIPTERKEEAVRLHQSMLFDRFQGGDAQGEVFLSFSVDRIELMTRSIAGVEAPAVGLSLTPEK